jgi:hypothetical protein
MSPANDRVHETNQCEGLRRIAINPPLPCGVAHCGRLAHSGRIERDPEMGALWRLLPICDEHLASLAAAADEAIHAPHPDSPLE